MECFLEFLARPLMLVTLAEVQAFIESLERLAPSSRARAIGAVKSLLGWAQRTGYLPLNVGAALKLPRQKATLAERILDPPQVQQVVADERKPRNQVNAVGGLRRRPAGFRGLRTP